MKCNLHFNKPYKIKLLTLLLVMLGSQVFSQTFFGVSSSPADNGAQAGPTVTVTPPLLMVAGDLVIIYGHYRGTGVTMSVSAAAGQTWNTLATNNGSNQTFFVTWCRFNGLWTGIGPTISNGAGTNALTATMYVYRPTNANNLWGVNVNPAYTTSSNAAANSINSVTTTMPNTVTMAFWGNALATTWANLTGPGWNKAGLSAQYRNTTGTDQSHTAAYYLQTTAIGATGAVSQDQAAGTATLRTIMSWHELKNDNCNSAIPITAGVNCTNVPGSLSMATNSGVAVGSCTGTPNDDVWYSFVATETLQSIVLTNVNTSITGAGGGIRTQVFSGTCGALTSIACGITVNTVLTNLNIGSTYYIRIYSFNNTTIPLAGGFNICVQTPVFFGKSFINITKGTTGGTVETGDELEIRASIAVRASGNSLDSCAFFHTIPAGTSYKPGSLAILTNEGKVYKAFTDATNDDEGQIVGSNIKINMGYDQTNNPSTAFRRGRITSNNIPRAGGGTLMLASYRVFVTQTLNNTINTGGGNFTYSYPINPTNVLTRIFGDNVIKVYVNDGLCENATGVNVLNSTIAGDFSGTFGSGNTMNRIASPNVPAGLIYTPMNGNQPGDFFYSVINNTSQNAAGYSTVNTWPKPQAPSTNRVFGVFDVIGDHTNAVSQTAGNSAADTTLGKTGGYMLLVNAAFNLDTVFKYQISNLCPNTYYEISCWVRNICSRCGTDSVGRGASGVIVNPAYIPTAPGDSSGVYPNLSFSVDGVNHYTTGNMTYTGQWVKKGFTFLTGASQTNITLAIANNAPGGGGNDWLLDDIAVVTCLPGLNMRPSNAPTYCLNGSVDLSVAVSTFYNNYTSYQWERNTGSGWGPAPELPGIQTFSYTYSAPNYIDTVAIPTFIATSDMNGYQYRIRTATTLSNLTDDDCSIYNSTDIITISIHPTCDVLPSEFYAFNVQLKNEFSQLSWSVRQEENVKQYEIERSIDGRNFSFIGKIDSKNAGVFDAHYMFHDSSAVTGKVYYRIKMISAASASGKYSNILSVSRTVHSNFEISNLVNPFQSKLSFQLNAFRNEQVELLLTDALGHTLVTKKVMITKGSNAVSFEAPAHLQRGSYLLRIVSASASIHKIVQKQ